MSLLGSHTVENLLPCLKSFLEQRHIATRFIVQIVTDNGANIVRMSHLFFHAFCDSLYYFPHGCASLTIQLVIRSVLKRKDVERIVKPISDAYRMQFHLFVIHSLLHPSYHRDSFGQLHYITNPL
jgi:hypothetical protein